MSLRSWLGRGETDERAGEWGTSEIPPPYMASMGGGIAFSDAGQVVNLSRALGVPAVSDAIRVVSETIAILGLECWREGDDGLPQPARETWQWKLLERPALDWDAFSWKQVAGADIEGYGNFFARKVKALIRSDRQVLELIPLNPDLVRVRRVDGAKVFDVKEEPFGHTQTLTPADVLHIPGFRMGGKMSGYSPVLTHAHRMGALLALEEFQGRYFSQDAAVGLVLKVKGNLTRRAAARILRVFELTRSGSKHSHRPMLAYNGTEVERLGLGLKESQFIEASEFGVAEIERMFRLPSGELTGKGLERMTTEQLVLRLSTALAPRWERILSALASDPDLFYGRPEYPRFDMEKLLRVDAKTSAEVDHFRIQDGTELVDEQRARRGQTPLPPIPEDPSKEPGKVPQIVPVGGGANPAPPDAPGDTTPGGNP